MGRICEWLGALGIAALGIVPATADGAVATRGSVEDILFLNDAAQTKRTGRVVGVDGEFLRLEVSLAGGVPGAKATVSVPRVDVSRIEFAPNEELDRLLENATVAQEGVVAAVWRHWEPYLAVPKSPAARVAISYSNLLLEAGDLRKAREARGILKKVEESGWDEGQKLAAKQGRLRAMMATGDAAAAIDEARELARESEDPKVLIEAKFILAESAHRALRELVEEHPRWMEDVHVKPEYERLVHEAVDQYLYPYLFFGSEETAAARGLWGAVEVHRFVGNQNDALEAARDIQALYPASRFSEPAGKFLKTVSEKSPDNKNADQNEAKIKPKS